MPEINENPPATVPAQREAVGPVKKSTPVMIALIAIVALIGIANVSSLFSGKKRSAPASALPMRPSTANPQQVSSFESQQQMQARTTRKTSNGNTPSQQRCSNFSRQRLCLVPKQMERPI